MTKITLKIIVLLSALMLCGCMSPVKAPRESAYVLNKMPQHVPTGKKRSATLLVAYPDTDAAYNTSRMAYTMRPYEISYYSQNVWAETPGQMLLPLIVQTLQKTHRFRAIGSPPFMGHYDYVLNTQILTLVQDFTQQPAVLKLSLRVMLTKASTNRVVASKQISVTEPMTQYAPYPGVIAANKAAAAALQQIADFCIDFS